jgi:hypothetical protein
MEPTPSLPESPIDLEVADIFVPWNIGSEAQETLHDLSQVFWFTQGRITELQRDERIRATMVLALGAMGKLDGAAKQLCDRFYRVKVRVAEVNADGVIGAFLPGQVRHRVRWTLLSDDPSLDLGRIGRREIREFTVYLARFDLLAEFGPVYAPLMRTRVEFDSWLDAAKKGEAHGMVNTVGTPTCPGWPSQRDEVGYHELFGIIVPDQPIGRPSPILRKTLKTLQASAAVP